MSPLVKLVSITPDAQHLIAYCARVSNPSNQQNLDTEEKLLRYLIKHNHWSPFEMANMVVEINTTRAIAPQILRHRSFSFQEFSQRYADVSCGLGAPVMPSLRSQDITNRQNSIDDLPAERKEFYYRRISSLFADSEDLYREMVSNGVAKETARAVLPLASPTRLYMNGTIRSWIHYCDLRMSVETQKEHREIALNVMELLCQQLPDVAKAMWTHN
jgi:thymidylate synthase (FAD)